MEKHITLAYLALNSHLSFINEVTEYLPGVSDTLCILIGRVVSGKLL